MALLTSSLPALSAPKAQSRDIGIARIDITPDYPVRLSGYAARKTESQEVAQRIWAKALAIGSDRQKPAILITVDNCGVPASIREELVRRLSARKIAADRITICSSHTHSAPWLVGYLPNLVVGPLPAEQTARRQRYTGELIDNLEKVALQALADRAPAMLMRGTGRATFAANRRTQGGPVDHDVPVLFILGKDGKAKGILASYACHCTTLTGEFNQICGDWAGYAQEFLERDFPGCTAMITIGCGGDANPYPRPGFDLAQRHGQAIATAVQQVTLGQLTPVNGKLTCRTKTIQLPFDTLPTRAEWEEKAKDTGYIGQHARINLARLDQNQTLPTSLSYMVQVWTFEKNLAVAF
ncbi:MAG TPA: neutral/alkaline non-lysosomal ceramidase N-terminal domain-containing protein, partial [Clostridia bacterium]|nr:neutral/alkaline non-lysosomal ceramidase N-terminal domain-containing protein [Clostridia bacterium]